MRRAHFERLRPTCPTCARAAALELLSVERERDGTVLEGRLGCTNGECLREYPIVDGLPLVLANLREHVSENALALLARDDLAAATESLIGDCCGPSSTFDTLRQHLSNYAWDHYGDLDPLERGTDPAPGSVVRVLHACLDAAGELPSGPVLEVGCSVGRASFELARRTRREVLGVDIHHAKLRLASRVLREQRVVYARRRVGLAYDRREFAARFEGSERVDFWSCDAAALPFANGTFACVVALNVLDCARAPLEVLESCARMLVPGGVLVLACPYDWSANVTPIESWIGGHSQRGPNAGASEPLLRALLTPGAHAQSLGNVTITAELDDLAWHVRLHDRSSVRYRVHALIARAS